eukprot:901871-Prymnesium_polylepis.1
MAEPTAVLLVEQVAGSAVASLAEALMALVPTAEHSAALAPPAEEASTHRVAQAAVVAEAAVARQVGWALWVAAVASQGVV